MRQVFYQFVGLGKAYRGMFLLFPPGVTKEFERPPNMFVFSFSVFFHGHRNTPPVCL